MSLKLRLIGDLHGESSHSDWVYTNFAELVQPPFDLVIQIGDFGYNYDHVDQALYTPELFVLAGNHEDHPKLRSNPCGITTWKEIDRNGVKIFCLGGGYSIDREKQIEKKRWDPQEENSFQNLLTAYKAYLAFKPHILIAHEACHYAIHTIPLDGMSLSVPFQIYSPTSQTIQMMVDEYQPDYVFNGHWHQSGSTRWGTTNYVSLGIRQVFDLEISIQNGKPSYKEIR